MKRLFLALALGPLGCSSGGFGHALEGGGLFGAERCVKLAIAPAPAARIPISAPPRPCPDPAALREHIDSLTRRGYLDRALRLARREQARCPGIDSNDLTRLAKTLLAELPADPYLALRQGLTAQTGDNPGHARMLLDAALIKLEAELGPPFVAEKGFEKSPSGEDSREPIKMVQFSLDGTRLVVAGQRKQAALVDLTGDSGARIFPLAEERFFPWTLAISPSGGFIGVRAHDSLQVFATSNGALAASLAGHEKNSEYSEEIDAAGFFWDGKRVATGDEKGTLRVFRVSDGALLSSTGALRDELQALAPSPDGRFIATAFESESAVRIRSPDGADTFAILNTTTDEIDELAWSTQGRHIAASALHGRAIDVWDLATCTSTTLTDRPPCHPYEDGSCGHSALFGMDIAPDGSRVAGALDEAGFFLWDTRSGKRLATSPLSNEDRAWDVAFSHDGTLLAGASVEAAFLFRLGPNLAALEPLARMTFLSEGAEGYALDLERAPNGAPRPTGHYDVFGAGVELVCRMGPKTFPLALCEDRLRVPGLVGRRARGLGTDPLDLDPPG